MSTRAREVVSATQDARHKTVLDLIKHPQKHELHLIERLDFNTTGLLLLSNDGDWSRRISLAESKLFKQYSVTVAKPLNADYINVFEQGIYFAFENITTAPVRLEIQSAYTAFFWLTEGK